MNPDQKMIDLAEKWMNGTISPEEERVFAEWYNASQDEEVVLPASYVPGEQAHRDRILRLIRRQMGQDHRRITRWVPAMAAAFILLLGTGAWWWTVSRKSAPASLLANAHNPVRPVSEKTTLTLGDGSTVDLGAAKDGSTTQNGEAIIDKRTARLIYKSQAPGAAAGAPSAKAKATAAAAEPSIAYNTLTTRRGGTYSIILPDGTKAWLNACSSLRYPTVFRGKTREVSLTGEAYFEVAPDKDQPFKVQVHGMTIDVLGTHFDVMAYDDEPAITTTLLQGSVRIQSADKRLLLTPGQQSRLQKDNGDLETATVDVEDAVAWKNGIFRFKSEDIHSVMRKVARWYDVDVRYDGQIAEHFTGAVPRDSDVSVLLQTMELTNEVKFTVDGKTITVAP